MNHYIFNEDFSIPPPKIKKTPVDSTKLNENEISSLTKQSCGYINFQSEKQISISKMIQNRELGELFTNGQRCNIGNIFLPNKITKIAKYQNRAFCGSFSADGKFLLTASQDHVLYLYHTENGKFIEFKKIFPQNISWSILDTAFSPDGNYFAYSSWSENLIICPIYDDSTNQEILPLRPAGMGRFSVFSLRFSKNGDEIVAAANDGCLYIYNRECHQPGIKQIEGHTDDVNAVAFADDTSQILYSGGDDGLCKVWDRRTLNESNPQPVGIFVGHIDGITYVDSRGDGRYLLTNSKDQTIKLWDVRAFSSSEAISTARKIISKQDWDYRWHTHVTQQLMIYLSHASFKGDSSIMTYRGHMVVQTLIRCHFSPAATTGQRFIYTGCGQGRVVIYDLLTGKIVRMLKGHSGCVRDVNWHPYHQEIVSTSWDGLVGCWRYSSIDEDSDCCG